MLAALMALDASLVFADAKAALQKAPAAAARWPDGLLVFIEIPLADGRRFLFERGFKPVISVAVAAGGGSARAAFGCAFERALVRDIALDGDAETLAAGVARDLPEPVSDWIASGAYRRNLARVLLARHLRALGRP
jgi:CO/xanthine dehydrogenase FAD-binding subunit